jgi:uncharacterized delta-60 repeat protein
VRRTSLAIGLATLLIVLAVDPAVAAPGGLDISFSGDGWAATDFGSDVDLAFDVAISEATGTIVSAGRGSGGRIAVARYLPNGALDATFSGDGKVLTDLTSGTDSGYGVGIQLDGKVVVAGGVAGSGGRIVVVRYAENGMLDGTFGGGDGSVITNVTPGDDYAWAMAIQPVDQKIVVAGGAGGAGGRFLVARYTSNGTPDASFGGGDGRVLTDFTAGYDYVDALAIQADGKIVAAGSTNYYGNAPRFALARYEASGALDAAFGGGDGKVVTNFPIGYAWAFGVAIQDDDKIVAAGQSGPNTALARYLSSGAIDATFGGGDGKVTVNLTPGGDYADEVMVQSDGRIVVVGTGSFTDPDPKITVARFTAGGGLDASFSGDGKVVSNFARGGADFATGASLQPSNGRIVVVGRTSKRFLAARYLV